MQIHKYFNVFQIPCISNTPQHCIMLFHVYNSSSVCACVMLFPVFYSNSVSVMLFHVFYSSSVCVSWVFMYFTAAVCVMLFHVFYSCSVCHAFPFILQQQQCVCVSWVSMYFTASVCVMLFHVFYSCSVSCFSMYFTATVCVSCFSCHWQPQCESWFSMCLAALFNSSMSTAHFNDQSRSAYVHTDIAFKLRFCIPNILVLLHHVICPQKTLYIQTSFLPSIHPSFHPSIH